MATTLRTALLASILAVGVPLVGSLPVIAQDAGAQQKAPKQVPLTQAQIDGLVAAQKDVRAAEAGAPQDKPDPKADAKIASIVKAHGFDSLDQYADVSYSVGLVLAGLDPDTKTYVGPSAVIQKQITQIKADKSMPAKEKTEALSELNEALKQGDADKPAAGNIALVRSNFDKLNQAMQQSD